MHYLCMRDKRKMGGEQMNVDPTTDLRSGGVDPFGAGIVAGR